MRRTVNNAMAIAFLLSSILNVHTAEAYDEMNMKLTRFFQEVEGVDGAVVGVSVRSSKSGKILFEKNGDIRLRPASNLKLLTAAAALSTLGPNHRFKTEVQIDGKVSWGFLNGNLYLKGKGDPTLIHEDLVHFARDVRDAGVKFIKGDVIVDDSWFDDVRYSVDVPWSDETYDYAAQISALTLSPSTEFDTGCVLVEVSPHTKSGKKAVVQVEPEYEDIALINEVVTVVADEVEKEMKVAREHGTNTIHLSGEIPLGAEKISELVPIWEPTELVGKLFAEALKEQGVILLGDVKIGLVPESEGGKSDEKVKREIEEKPLNVKKVIDSHESMPLSELIIPFMKYSINSHGEVLVKEMGRNVAGVGTWDDGLEVVLEELGKFDVDTDALVLRDGSGISHVNLVPANELTQLLFAVQNEDWFPQFLASLPVSGVSEKNVGGTLRNRMKGDSLKGKVLAKTGSLSTISSLSGYVETSTGERLIFSILLNNLVDDDVGKKIEDDFVSILVE